MKTTDFVKKFYSYAKDAELKTGINLEYILARQALETGWGMNAPGNNCFGIKASKNWKGKTQLLKTHEHFADDMQSYRFPHGVISITKKVGKNGKTYFDYLVWDLFRAYDSLTDCYVDHCQFYFQNSRYAKALKVKNDAKAFNRAVNEAGYSTGTNVINTLNSIIDSISKIIEDEKLEATVKPLTKH